MLAWAKEHRWSLASAVVFSAALTIRSLYLGQGYWIDEVISVETAGLPIMDLLYRAGFYDVHPPLYYLLLSGHTALFGAGELSTRLLSLFFSAATLVLVWLWGNRTSRWVGFLALSLLSLSTFHVHYSIEVRSYSLLAFLCTAFLFMYDRMSSEATPPSRASHASLFGIEAALLLTHYYAALPIIAVNIHFFTVRRHRADRVYRWALVQLGALAVVLLWTPLFMVQYLHLPEGVFAHLRTATSMEQLVLSMGLAPVHPSLAVAWGSSILVAGAALWTVGDSLRRGRTASPSAQAFGAAPLLPMRRLILLVGVLLVGLAAPMIAAAGIKASQTTFSLLLQELPRCYLVFFGAVFILITASVLNQRALLRGHGIAVTPFVTMTVLMLFALLLAVQEAFLPRNLIFLAPLLCLLAASAWKPASLFSRATVMALVLGVTVPSLVSAPAAFEPRQDFKGIASFVRRQVTMPDAEGIANFVIPMWDRPGLEFYLGPGTANGIMSPRQIPAAQGLPDTVNLILTRQALEQRRVFVEFAARSLSPEFELSLGAAFSGAYVAAFQRVHKGASQ